MTILINVTERKGLKMNMNELFNFYREQPETDLVYTPYDPENEGEVFGVVSKQSDGWYYCQIFTTCKFTNRTGLYPVQKHYKNHGAYVSRFMAKYGLLAYA